MAARIAAEIAAVTRHSAGRLATLPKRPIQLCIDARVSCKGAAVNSEGNGGSRLTKLCGNKETGLATVVH
jgi:hypothetical protein